MSHVVLHRRCLTQANDDASPKLRRIMYSFPQILPFYLFECIYKRLNALVFSTRSASYCIRIGNVATGKDALVLVLHVDRLHQEIHFRQLALHPHQLLLKEEDRCLAELAPQLQMAWLLMLEVVLHAELLMLVSAVLLLNMRRRAAADSVTGPASKGSDACTTHVNAFQDCINNYESDISKCQFYMDMLNECRWGSGAASR
ncbi:hypothetical protein OPV22_031904 [Ensete ventricosum]|uniref:CHCH domain-containing protein n=1 Tax=Ensete ventricosum TaxID=4639 RepID=A0AAV8PQ81_ENSVE|nr:hypothetical protein OPV22_031904 [Ensete ventricosum]